MVFAEVIAHEKVEYLEREENLVKRIPNTLRLLKIKKICSNSTKVNLKLSDVSLLFINLNKPF